MNLKFVADRAKVSVATVSRVINDRGGVSEGKADEIRKIIDDLGFIPKKRAGRSNGSQLPEGLRYGNVAILALGSGHIGASELFVRQLEPICQGLSRFGVAPVICMGISSTKEMPLVLQKKQIDGILIFGDMDDSLRSFFEGIPVFWMTSHHEGSSELILTGNREIGQAGANYFHDKGCRNVVAVSTYSDSEVYRIRCDAFMESTRRFSMKSCLLHGEKLSDIEAVIDDVVVGNSDLLRKADGIFFPSDPVVACAYPALHRIGVFDLDKPPIMVSCGGEKNYLSGLDPRPVSVDMGADLLGKQAVEQIFWRIRYPEEKRQFSVVIHPEIIEP